MAKFKKFNPKEHIRGLAEAAEKIEAEEIRAGRLAPRPGPPKLNRKDVRAEICLRLKRLDPNFTDEMLARHQNLRVLFNMLWMAYSAPIGVTGYRMLHDPEFCDSLAELEKQVNALTAN